jgi:hypothetical protein
MTDNEKLHVIFGTGAMGMAIEQALIFVGHHFRLRHLEYRPSR